jgi:hypothetical protein
VDLANLGLHHHLAGLTSQQKRLFEDLMGHTRHFQNDGSSGEESPELGEVTLLPITRVESSPGTVEPLVKLAQSQLEALLQQGMPGMDNPYVRQIVTFIEESAANIRDHAGEGASIPDGFVAANRTRRQYRDKARNQWIEVYTTYVSCYDLGRGIFAALVSSPSFAAKLAQYPEGDRSKAALQLSILPGVTSRDAEEGRGGGLPRMVNIVRSIANVGNGHESTYRGGLRLISGGAILDNFTTTSATSSDRVLPGTQLQLRFDAIRRIDN